MKTSNKILLGSFIVTLLLFVSLHATIYVKYKRGDYIMIEEGVTGHIYKFQNVKYVILENLNVQLHSADTTSFQYKWKPGSNLRFIEYRLLDDSLIVFAKTNNKKDRNVLVNLNVSKDVLVHAKSSRVLLARDKNISNKNKVAAPSFQLKLDRSNIDVTYEPSLGVASYHTLRIDAKNSSQIFLNNAAIGLADISLQQSHLNLVETSIDSLNLKNDKASTVIVSRSNVPGLKK